MTGIFSLREVVTQWLQLGEDPIGNIGRLDIIRDDPAHRDGRQTVAPPLNPGLENQLEVCNLPQRHGRTRRCFYVNVVEPR